VISGLKGSGFLFFAGAAIRGAKIRRRNKPEGPLLNPNRVLEMHDLPFGRTNPALSAGLSGLTQTLGVNVFFKIIEF
jgi:hypothetical protein